jgi:hypothetical protein
MPKQDKRSKSADSAFDIGNVHSSVASNGPTHEEFVKVEPLKTVLSGNRGAMAARTESGHGNIADLSEPPTRCFDLPPQMSILRKLARRLSFEVNGRFSWVVLAAASGRDFRYQIGCSDEEANTEGAIDAKALG